MEIARLCVVAGMSRQNYYKQRRVRQKLSIDETLVLALVHQERARQPELGARKLLRLIGPELQDAGVSIGRDRFFSLLFSRDLLIERQASSSRTTRSGHGFATYLNRARDLVLSGPHQLWVSDLTYVRTREGFMYLALTMDAWSRAIVGYDCSDSLEMQGALRSLQMAVRQLPSGCHPMHHSDRGIQYCCGAYIAALREAGLSISMTEENHCYENAKAERLNGILKQEYGLGQTLASKHQAQALTKQGVKLYNHFRPHMSLQYEVPMHAHTAA